MAIEIVMKKNEFGQLVGDSDYDKELLAQLTVGNPVKVKITTITERSYQHHKLFFGGLLPFAYQYYDAGGGMISDVERNIINGFVKRLAKVGGVSLDVMQAAADEYLLSVASKRLDKYGGSVTKNIKTFRDWLVVEAGYFTLESTPAGVRKIPNSLSYRQMASQEDFNVFYKDCFAVVWNLLLQSRFDSPEQAEKAINELMLMG